jgi:hypothetical protein
METFRKTLASICALLFISTALLAMFLFTLDIRGFSAETYQKAFARNDFYNKIPSMLVDVLVSLPADQSQFPVMMQGMDRDGWESFIRALLPPEAWQAMGDEALNSTFEYVNMRTDSVSLNLVPLKTSMAGETGVQAVMSLLGTLPECTLLQIGQMSMNLFSGGQFELCNPPADLYPMLTPVIQSQMQFTASVLPDQVQIISAPLINDPRQRLQSARLLMRWSPLLPFFFLFGLTVFAVRSLKDWLNWWGLPLLITGFIAFALGILGTPIFGRVFQRLLATQMSGVLPLPLLGYGSDLASAMIQALFAPVIGVGLGLTVIGAGMAGVGYYLHQTR